MNKSIHTISWESDHLSDDTLRSYSFHSLSKADIRIVELHLVDCGFCADRAEGYSVLQNETNLQSDLQSLTSAFEKSQSKVPVFYLRPNFYYSAAALLILFLGFSFLLKNNHLPISVDMADLQKKESPIGAKPEREQLKEEVVSSASEVPSTLKRQVDEKQLAQNKVPSSSLNKNSVATFEYNATESVADKNMSDAEAPVLTMVGGVMQTDDAKDKSEVIQTAISQQTNVNDEIAVLSKQEEKVSTNTITTKSSSDMDVSRNESHVMMKSAPAQAMNKSDDDADSRKSKSTISLFEQGLRLYRTQKYKQANEKFKSVGSNDVDAIAFMQFIKLIDDNDASVIDYVKNYQGKFKEDAEWSLVVYYLTISNKEEAKNYLTKLKYSKGNYSIEAIRRLNSLNSK